MVVPSRRRKGTIGANKVSSSVGKRSVIIFCSVGILTILYGLTFYGEVNNLHQYDGTTNFADIAVNDDADNSSRSNNNNNNYNDEYDDPFLNYDDFSVQEIQESFDYISSFTDESFQRPLTFFHIPKNAGTAIEHAAGISNRTLSWGSCMFNHGRKRVDCTYPPGGEWPDNVGWWHIPSHFFPLARINPYKQSELFGVIRDPYDRMVSEFYYICTLKVFSWRPDQCHNRTRLYDVDYMNEWIQNKLVSTQQDEDRMTGKSYLTDNGHFIPQHEFVFAPYGVRMLDHVLTLDDPNYPLTDQFNHLMTTYGMPDIQLEKFNAFGAEERKAGHLTVNDLFHTTKTLIETLYADDFNLRRKYQSTED